jgi:hypothetical protein
MKRGKVHLELRIVCLSRGDDIIPRTKFKKTGEWKRTSGVMGLLTGPHQTSFSDEGS